MSILHRQTDDSSVISLDGVIDICSAVELKTTLLEMLKAGKAIHVLLEKTTDLDVTAVQLLWAAKREAKRSAISFEFAGYPSAEILSSLSSVGLDELEIFD